MIYYIYYCIRYELLNNTFYIQYLLLWQDRTLPLDLNYQLATYRDLLCFFLVDTIGSSLSLKSLKLLTSSFCRSACSSVINILFTSNASSHLNEHMPLLPWPQMFVNHDHTSPWLHMFVTMTTHANHLDSTCLLPWPHMLITLTPHVCYHDHTC